MLQDKGYNDVSYQLSDQEIRSIVIYSIHYIWFAGVLYLVWFLRDLCSVLLLGAMLRGHGLSVGHLAMSGIMLRLGSDVDVFSTLFDGKSVDASMSMLDGLNDVSR